MKASSSPARAPARRALALGLLGAGTLAAGLVQAAQMAQAEDRGGAPRAERWIGCRLAPAAEPSLALRAAPAADAPVIARMDPRDGFFLAALRGERTVVRGDWMLVLYVPPVALGSAGVETLGRSGWMHRSANGGCDA